MAKNSTKISFSKATIMKDEHTGEYTISEILKDDIRHYNLTEILDRFCGVDGISLTLVSDSEMETV